MEILADLIISVLLEMAEVVEMEVQMEINHSFAMEEKLSRPV
jgi:hypothetical protein